MGNGGKCGNKYGSNSAGVGYALQVSSSDGDDIWEKYLGGDVGHVRITRGIPLSGIQKFFGDDDLAYDGQRFGMSHGGQRTREHRALANQGIYPEDEGYHGGTGGLMSHI